MTYKILENRRTVAKNLATIQDAYHFLAGWGDMIDFELDPENDAADAALVRKGGALEIYAIERED